MEMHLLLRLLKPHPNVGLDVFDEVAKVNGTVGVRQSGSDENLSSGHVKLGYRAGIAVLSRTLYATQGQLRMAVNHEPLYSQLRRTIYNRLPKPRGLQLPLWQSAGSDEILAPKTPGKGVGFAARKPCELAEDGLNHPVTVDYDLNTTSNRQGSRIAGKHMPHSRVCAPWQPPTAIRGGKRMNLALFAAAVLSVAAPSDSLALLARQHPATPFCSIFARLVWPLPPNGPRRWQPARRRLSRRRVNVDQERALATKYGVEGIPCFVMIVNGHEVDRAVGVTDRNRLAAMFSRNGVGSAVERCQRAIAGNEFQVGRGSVSDDRSRYVLFRGIAAPQSFPNRFRRYRQHPPASAAFRSLVPKTQMTTICCEPAFGCESKTKTDSRVGLVPSLTLATAKHLSSRVDTCSAMPPRTAGFGSICSAPQLRKVFPAI